MDSLSDPLISNAKQVEIGNYVLSHTLGEGSYGKVKLAVNKETGEEVAIKIIPKSEFLQSPDLQEKVQREISLMKIVSHPGILKLIDVLESQRHLYIVMEYAEQGELFDYLVTNQFLEPNVAIEFFRQIVCTVDYLHSLGICHRDLKPENLLIDEFGRVKISDFGLSRFVDKNGLVDTPCGSPCYASPECVSGKPYDGRKSDIWSIGVISYAMLTGQLPWTKRNQQQLFEQIRRGEYIIPNYLSEQCRNFIQGLMTVDTTRRLTVDLALAHPWIRGCQVPLQMPLASSNMISLQQVDLFFDRDGSDSSLKSIEIEESPSMKICDFDEALEIIEDGEQR